jgi:hypothetical protein
VVVVVVHIHYYRGNGVVDKVGVVVAAADIGIVEKRIVVIV